MHHDYDSHRSVSSLAFAGSLTALLLTFALTIVALVYSPGEDVGFEAIGTLLSLFVLCSLGTALSWLMAFFAAWTHKGARVLLLVATPMMLFWCWMWANV